MFEPFYPSIRENSAYSIDYQGYYDKGIRGILFDIDNTLVPHGADATPEAEALFVRLRQIGFAVCFISNNNRERVERFNRQIRAPFLYHAHKPAKKGFLQAMEIMHTAPSSTLFVGDQLFTDVWGARRVGIFSILVNPIDPKEEIQIVLKRKLERFVLREYESRKRNS